MTLGEHLEELRRRVFYALLGLAPAVGLTLFFGKDLIKLLERPYVHVLTDLGRQPMLIPLRVTGGFFAYFRVALLGGLILACPWIFYQLWLFVAAGLYRHEKRLVHWAVPFSAGLFVCGALFFLLIVAYPMLRFFTAFNLLLDLEPVVQVQELITFMTNLMLVFGLAFQTPVLVFMLNKMGVVSLARLRRYRRHVIVGMLIVAAMLTSPSPVDQIAMAVPMWLLYELGIALCHFLGPESRRRSRDDE